MSKKKSILLVFPMLPYPARRHGISIRYAPIIEHMTAEHDIHVVVIADESIVGGDVSALQALCKSFKMFKRKKQPVSLVRKLWVRLQSLLPGATPHAFYCYDQAEIEKFLRSEVAGLHYDAITWVSSWYIDIGLRVFDPKSIVLDAIDSAYLHHARELDRSLLHQLDERRLLQWERDVTQSVRATTYVSPVDAKEFSRVVSGTSVVHVIPNGVYLADFSSGGAADGRAGMTLGFLGNMAYPPNIAAAGRLVTIFEKLADSSYRLMIIGRDPVEKVRALASDRVQVTGTVDNIWPYVDAVDCFVFPMLSGAGQQNKVLEAMYAEKVVVCNAMANGGIGGVHGEHLLVCETDEEFVEAIAGLQADPARARAIAARGRQFVVENYSWSSIFPRLETVWFEASSGSGSVKPKQAV